MNFSRVFFGVTSFGAKDILLGVLSVSQRRGLGVILRKVRGSIGSHAPDFSPE